jgi:hypothetical protein
MQVAKQRRGIPQLPHPHTLAMGGLEALEAMLPGFQAEASRECVCVCGGVSDLVLALHHILCTHRCIGLSPAP